MKKQDISHWIKNEYYLGVLLFAQTLEECLFNYSYESYKIPSLNAHYLCYDILQTTYEIERKVLFDGNFVPLAEEFEQTLREDLFINTHICNDNTILLIKEKNGCFHDLTECDLRTKIKRYAELAEYIKDVCETQNSYLQETLNMICENIFVENYTYDNMATIYSSTRMFVTDLVNSGYSKKYLYLTVQDYFFNTLKQVKCDPDTILDFFNCFTFEEFNYNVIFGINKKASSFFEKIDNFKVRKANSYEKKKFNLQRERDCIASLRVESIDSYSAFNSAFQYINTVLALHMVNQHEGKLYVTPKTLVSKINSDGSEDKAIPISTPINPMKKEGNSSDLHALISDISLLNNVDPPKTFFRAVALHLGAMESKDISNQLLNLWTAIEVLIDTKRDSEDRISTICNILCSVLNRCYLYSLIEQLYCDVKACSEIDIDLIVSKIEYKDSSIDKTERFALILSLEEYSEELQSIIASLGAYPLLTYRIEYYKKYVLIDSESVYTFLKRHEKRLRWHIMRIYRNRNMIVHSGSYMPYRNLIIENLHFYVDVLLDTLIEYYHFGLTNNQSIYHNIMSEEISYLNKLGISPKNIKQKQKVIPITSENALDLIFNGYAGNTTKKAIEHAIKTREPKNKLNAPTEE